MGWRYHKRVIRCLPPLINFNCCSSCTAGYDILLNKTILKLSLVPRIIKIDTFNSNYTKIFPFFHINIDISQNWDKRYRFHNLRLLTTKIWNSLWLKFETPNHHNLGFLKPFMSSGTLFLYVILGCYHENFQTLWRSCVLVSGQ